MADFPGTIARGDKAVYGSLALPNYVGVTVPLQASSQDESPPTVENFSPPTGSPLTYDSAIGFTVTDETGLAAVMVFVTYPDESSEVVWDGTRFLPPFSRRSTVQVVGNSLIFSVARGWRKAPTIKVLALDGGGNLAEEPAP